MKNLIATIIITIVLFFSSLLNKMFSQENQANEIIDKIELITREEKALLKSDINDINKKLENGTISKAEADAKKIELAKKTAANIETRVNIEKGKLNLMIENAMALKSKKNSFVFEYGESNKYKNNIITIKNRKDTINKKYVYNMFRKNDSIELFKRNSYHLVMASGLNNVMTNGAVANSDFRYWGSHFYEWGFTRNSRLLKNNGLLHANYGFSVMYNNLRPTQNRIFAVDGNQTNLQTNPVNMSDSRMKNVYLVFPMHLEFDFSKSRVSKKYGDKTYYPIHESFRFGIGGYLGMNLKTKNYIETDIDGYESETITKGGFNTSNFIYGLSTYIGYRSLSLYAKYDLNPLFRNNVVKQNNISLGLRFDL